jgi:hypothetical protein
VNERRTWEEFRKIGLLWWVNRILHLFGWVVVFQIESDGAISDVYPARTKFRGFFEANETEGFKALTAYLKEEAASLLKDTED